MIWLVEHHPGLTAREYGVVYYGSEEVPHKRLPELDPFYVIKGYKRKCKHTGRMAVTWWPTERGFTDQR